MAYIGKIPAAAAITASDLDPAVITGQTALATSPADTDEFLISDAGVLKRLDASLVGSPGITEADQFRLTANQSAGTNAVVTSNLERVDTDGFGLLGTGLTNSSGVFSFPSTGYYLIMVTAKITAGSSHNDAQLIVETTTDNSTYEDAVQVSAADGSGGTTNYSVHGQFIFDVTNVSTHKFRLITASMSSSFLNGDTAKNETHFTTIKLAST